MNAFLPICKKVAARLRQASRPLALVVALGLPTLSQAQTIAFPRNVPFTGTDAGGFTLGGNAFLTATGSSATNGAVSGTAIDANGSGVLRLTNAIGNPNPQAGYAVDNNIFATPGGFSISFEFFSYGTNTAVPADGFSVFLVDGAGTTPGSSFAIGGFGGSLGYAQRQTSATVTEPGVTKGYLGIGIDEYGNYGISSEGRTGGYPGQGTTLLPNAVSLRGPYDPSDATYKTGYAYLAGSNSLPFNLAVGTSNTSTTTQGSRITDQANAGYRKAFINVIPVTANGSTIYKITVRIQNGPNVTTAVSNFTVTNPPSTLRVGFGASTGGSNSIHEIRSLKIVQAPIANDDVAGTKYNQPVTIRILDNDLNGGGANIVPGTVDLNPGTIARDNTYTVAGGTFTVDANGVVTFTPTTNFSGRVVIPYTVQNQNNDISNPGTITVNVTGADVETAVSGPATVNPGTTASYSVTTTNNGVEDAVNVMPTLTLPAGFTYVSGGSYNATTRVVTFPSTTLKAGQSASANSVLVTAPVTTSTGNNFVSNYTYPVNAAVPDAVSSNNSATLSVTVAGSANIAGQCSVPGKDGPVTLAAGTTPNTYYAGTGTASAGNTTLTVNPTPTPTGGTTIVAGDLLLIMQMQGATMTTTNGSTYGNVSAATAGTYEYAVAASAVSATGSLTLARPLANSYTYNASTSTATPFQQFQIIRIPQYSSLILAGKITGLAWNGSTGGVLALEVAGATTFNSGASLNMDGMGFRGGPGRVYTVATDGYGTTTTYVAKLGIQNPYAAKGEGIAGTPAGLGAINSYENYANGSYSLGRAGTAGGGGMVNPNDATYSGSWTGGGGGANGGGGSNSQNATNVTTSFGGAATPSPTTTQLYLGSGGGAGITLNAAGTTGVSGSNGGGIIFLRTNTASGSGTVSANGSSAITVTSSSGGGGGAGGTIVLIGNDLSTLTATANGGDGGFASASGRGDGGAGGGGVVYSNTAVGSAVVSPTVTGGKVNNTNNTAKGSNGITNPNVTIGANCAPTLTTTLSTTKPNVARSNNMQTAYVYTVSNTGGGITGLTALPNLAAVNGVAGLFTYTSLSSAILQLTDGTTQDITANVTANGGGTSTPTFTLPSNLIIPSGASVVFTFVANIANSAVIGTAYGSNAATSYFDPQRTAATGTATAPAYASNGTNSADVVTIVVPLPVKLTRFTVAAAGMDAILNWETAQELNNRYFEVERSIDGQAFESVGTVAGNGTTMLASTYRYTDAGAGTRTADVLYYRLRQVDYDGQSSFSPVRTVQFRRTGASVSLYPNPTTSSVTLDLSQLPAGDYTVQVFETTGRLVQRGTYQPGKQTLPLESLPTGAYFVKVQGASLTKVLPLIKQ